MRRPLQLAALTWMVGVAAITVAGCGDDASRADGGLTSRDADFSNCKDTPAVPYMAGWTVTSTAGTYVGTVVSAVTQPSATTAGADHPEVGLGDWVVTVTAAADGSPADVTMTAEKPWMPRHGHGSDTVPTVAPGAPGMFTVTKIDFFMPGYWQVKLDLQPTAGGDADQLTFNVCIPS